MDNPDLSLAFYRYLCNVIGTEDVVNLRRHVYTTFDHIISKKRVTSISSGSKSEGLNLEGSDFDVMQLVDQMPVYESINTVRKLPVSFPFVMNTTYCKPGFTWLQKHFSYDGDNDLISLCEYNNGIYYLSSFDVRNSYILHNGNLIPHGPCCSTPDGSHDIAICLRCEKWILQAQPWIVRSRNSWASPYVINAILEFGILFVPVGCNSSPNIDLEWRISFSYAEKLLIWSFNHVQLLCYALIKILLKEVITQITGDLLCSYFLKTILLWICEETRSSPWKPNNIMSCFVSCLNRLIYCVQYKTCAHYFIPENDLFAERFSEQQHRLLLSTLIQLQSLGWTCLLHTKTLASFKGLLVPSPLSSLEPSSSYLQSLFLLGRISFEILGYRLDQNLHFCLRSNKRDGFVYMISVINSRISQNLLKGDRRCNGNKCLYQSYRKRLCHLLVALNHDALSGWIMLASFYYVNNQYHVCKRILSDCLSRCTPDKFLLTENISIEEHFRFNMLQKKLGLRHLSSIRKYIINDVRFAPSSPILPGEMRIIYDNGDDDGSILAPSVAFGLFLKFLCDHNLRNDETKDGSLRALEYVVQNEYHIYDEYYLEIAHMLLSIAYSLRGIAH